MQFGLLLIARRLDAVGPLARLAEEQGFALLGCADVPALIYDPYMALVLAAQHTTRVRLGPMVTNPETRHPLILANQAAALDQLAPGRTFVGLGRGNAGVHTVGLRPASLANVGRAAALIRRVLAGETATWDEQRLQLNLPARPVPLMLAGSGPRGLRGAGREADVALLAVGATPAAVGEAVGWVAEGAASAGRAPGAVECWAYVDAAVAANRAQGRVEATTAAAARANVVFRGPALSRVPSALQAPVTRLIEEYDYSEHMKPGRGANYRLAERLGLIDFLLDQFAIAGTPDECRAQLERLRASGLENVCFNLSSVGDVESALRLFGEQVFPLLST